MKIEKEILTLKDIRKAMKLLKKDKVSSHKIKFDWGWIETDELGLPGIIGFSKESMESIKNLVGFNNEGPKGKFKIKNVMGIDVVEDLK